jgi:hypothetical protein
MQPTVSTTVSLNLKFSLKGVAPSSLPALKPAIKSSTARLLKVLESCVGEPVFDSGSGAVSLFRSRSLAEGRGFRALMGGGALDVSVPVNGESQTMFNTSLAGASPVSSALQVYQAVTQAASVNKGTTFASNLGRLIVASNTTAFSSLVVTGLSVAVPNNPHFMPTPKPSPAPTAMLPPSTTPAASSPQATAQASSLPAIIGGTVGGVIFIAALFGLWYFRKHKALAKMMSYVADSFSANRSRAAATTTAAASVNLRRVTKPDRSRAAATTTAAPVNLRRVTKPASVKSNLKSGEVPIKPARSPFSSARQIFVSAQSAGQGALAFFKGKSGDAAQTDAPRRSTTTTTTSKKVIKAERPAFKAKPKPKPKSDLKSTKTTKSAKNTKSGLWSFF